MKATHIADNELDLVSPLKSMITSKGNDLYAYTFENPVLLIFLRQFGCIFCREGLQDLAKKQDYIYKKGFKIVFIHQSDNETAESYFKQYNIKDPEHISDPTMVNYSNFRLGKGKFNQLFGFKTWVRGFEAKVIKGNSYGRVIGDGFQMPGVFILLDGEVRARFVHKLVSDQPDYEDLLKCCIRLSV